MGKSPGRWIKNVLFGKKHPKSNLSENATRDKKAAEKTPVEDLSGNSPVISDPCIITDKSAENLELESSTSGVPCNTVASLPVNQGVESQSNFFLVPASDDEIRRQGQAASKVQAALRGCLARRAFWALKGIIRLQALIRGHLVRRQAVATLRCMHAVIKLQALARGRRVRLSYTWPEVHKKYDMGELKDAKRMDIGAQLIFRSEKLATNAYVCKLLLSLPTALPLSLQYDLAEPNSAWNWLERWSLSHFWEPPAWSRKVLNVKPQKKQGASKTFEDKAGKSKRTIRKASSSANGDNGVLASFEVDRPTRNPRKATSHQMVLVQEQPQNELERVKRNLRKVSASVTTASEKSEIETEKPQQQRSSKTVLNSAAPDVSEREIVVSAENPVDLDVMDKQALVETPPETKTMDRPVDVLHEHPQVESHSLENGAMENKPCFPEQMTSKGDESGKNQKVRKRRSLAAKQEYAENISQNTPILPSYMAATESAKAKLRAQGSPRFSEEGAELGYVRRHSLPASTTGKLSSLSPRIQKPVQANNKGSSKYNRSMTLSRDDKALQPGWRR